MTVKIIACEVMKEELLAIKTDQPIEFEFISMGLHLYPKKLNTELQRIIDSSVGYSKIILAFGLCGGATKNLQAAATSLSIPKVHDCLPVLLGSKEIYEEFTQEERGTFYLSCGWMITEKNILSEHERIREKYGDKKASSILARMYDSYKRVLFIHTGCADEESSLAQSHQIAQLLSVSHHTTHGDDTYLNKVINGPWEEDDFIHISPEGIIEEEFFGIRTTA